MLMDCDREGERFLRGGRIDHVLTSFPEDVPTPEATDLINRCDEAQTYEARFAAGTLPKK